MKERKLKYMRGNKETRYNTYMFGERERERERKKRRIYESLLHTLAMFWSLSLSVYVLSVKPLTSHSFSLVNNYLRNDSFPLTLSGFVIFSVVIFIKKYQLSLWEPLLCHSVYLLSFFENPFRSGMKNYNRMT